MDAFWFTADEEQACTKAVELQPTHADDESDDVALGYIQGSKSIPTTFEAVNTLLSAQLLVTLYAGTTRLAASDECIGEQRVSLLPAVMSGQSRQQIHIPLSWDAQQRISLAVAVQCDAELVEFALGARVLQFQSLAIVNLPHDWTFECQTDEEAIRLCEAPDRNLACYEVEIELPAVTASEDGSNAEKFSFQGGKLTYEASVAAAVESEQEQQLPQEAEAESAGADGEGEDAANPTPKPCTGTWKVAFPNNQLPSKLYLKVNTLALLPLNVLVLLTVDIERFLLCRVQWIDWSSFCRCTNSSLGDCTALRPILAADLLPTQSQSPFEWIYQLCCRRARRWPRAPACSARLRA